MVYAGLDINNCVDAVLAMDRFSQALYVRRELAVSIPLVHPTLLFDLFAVVSTIAVSQILTGLTQLFKKKNSVLELHSHNLVSKVLSCPLAVSEDANNAGVK